MAKSETTGIDRRRFLGASAGAAAAIAGLKSTQAADLGAIASTGEVPPPPLVKLGKTGIELTRLAQGTGVHGGNRQSDQTRAGFRRARPRCSRIPTTAALSSSTWRTSTARTCTSAKRCGRFRATRSRFSPKSGGGTTVRRRHGRCRPDRPDACRATIERFCHEINTDHLDIVLLHCCMAATWDHDLEVYRDVLSEAKEKKQIGAVGVSCHTLEAPQDGRQVPVGRRDALAHQPQGRVDGRVDRRSGGGARRKPRERQGDHRHEDFRRRQTLERARRVHASSPRTTASWTP